MLQINAKPALDFHDIFVEIICADFSLINKQLLTRQQSRHKEAKMNLHSIAYK